MRKLFLLLAFALPSLAALASHIVGGEMIYEYLGPGAAANTWKYRITLRLFRDQNCPPPCAAMPPNVWIGIFDNDTKAQYPSNGRYYEVNIGNQTPISKEDGPPCITNPPVLNYNIGTYTFTVDLPVNAKGYTAAYQTCCRINPLANVFNTPAQGSGTGSTYICTIPGTDAVGTTGNTSPKYSVSVSPICQGKPFTLDFSATDADAGDSLVYTFCEAYDGGVATSATNINPAPPPYNAAPYINGFTGSQPMGRSVTIDRRTGIISGIAPASGAYVISVCALEYRKGKLINNHRKDFIVNVASCDYAGAQLQPAYTFCKSLTATFQNLNTSPLNKSYYWDFGDGNSSSDISPTHTYADTGTYTIKLVVNRGEPCGDSITAEVKVYPFFKADFSFAGVCLNKPTAFTDQSSATYGSIAAWQWNFGATADGPSTERNPQFTFNSLGPKNVRLIATSSKGCMDTITKVVDITDKPPVGLAFKDTLICKGDRLQLQATGTGTFSWTPTTNIENAQTASPTVFPATTTRYVVELNQHGCLNTDTVQVRVVDFVTIAPLKDTTICAADSIQLQPVTNALKFLWSPATGMRNTTVKSPIVTPAATTVYQLTASIGNCSATEDVTVTVAPYPTAKAGADTIICFDSEAQLSGQMQGTRFTWSPAELLTGAETLTPRARLQSSQAFLLTVYDDQGCPKPGRDTVVVLVLPKVAAFAGNDTTAVVGQSLQMQATGGVSYQWQPATALSDPLIANPVATFDGSFEQIRYKVLVANEAGCLDSASVSVKIFKTDPRIFVPTAFTPNGDGSNDIFRPVAVGINRMEYFRVYNRWGQLVFSTSVSGQGWDGRIKGKLQNTGTFVWVVKGVDYLGKEFFAKGTVTLIR